MSTTSKNRDEVAGPMRWEWPQRLFDGHRTTPHFGQISLWVLLITCAYQLRSFHGGFPASERGVPVSVFGLVAPEWLLTNAALLQALKYIYFFSGIAWAARLFPKIMPWICTLAFCLACSMYWESLEWFRHKHVAPAWLLAIYSCWYLFEADSIAKRKGFWSRRLFPT